MSKATKKPTWTTADGRVIKIAEMDDRHLTNTLRLAHRKADEGITVMYGGGSWEDGWYDEEVYHGIDALDHFPAYADLQREATKRGIIERYSPKSKIDKFYDRILGGN